MYMSRQTYRWSKFLYFYTPLSQKKSHSSPWAFPNVCWAALATEWPSPSPRPVFRSQDQIGLSQSPSPWGLWPGRCRPNKSPQLIKQPQLSPGEFFSAKPWKIENLRSVTMEPINKAKLVAELNTLGEDTWGKACLFHQFFFSKWTWKKSSEVKACVSMKSVSMTELQLKLRTSL